MRRVRWAVRLGLFAATLTLVAVLSGVWFTPKCAELTRAEAEPFDVAIILGAGMEPDGRLHRSAKGRVEAGVALYQNSLAARLHTTGGTAAPGGPAAGARMALYAQDLGVPATAITHEDASQSTLQNALFSAPFIGETERVILVTEGFHLTRSWLSFRWAGVPVDGLCHSTGLRQSSEDGDRGPVGMVVREVMAFWFNLARGAAWSVATALGFSGAKLDAILY